MAIHEENAFLTFHLISFRRTLSHRSLIKKYRISFHCNIFTFMSIFFNNLLSPKYVTHLIFDLYPASLNCVLCAGAVVLKSCFRGIMQLKNSLQEFIIFP